METAQRIEAILATLNTADVGALDSIVARMSEVRSELDALGQGALAEAAASAAAAIRRGDVAEFQRGRAFLQSKIGHLR